MLVFDADIARVKYAYASKLQRHASRTYDVSGVLELKGEPGYFWYFSADAVF
jgi:hypothetical protein